VKTAALVTRTASLWLLVAASAVGAVDEAPAKLTLEQTVDLALAQNPALQAIIERRLEVAAGVREARADAFPQVALVTAWTASLNPSLLNSRDFEEFLENFPGGGRFRPRPQELFNLALELRQALFTWGKVGAAIDLARLVEGFTEAEIETARLETALAAAEAYYGLLAASQQLAIVEIQAQVREESLAVVEARYEMGDATRLELLRSQAALAGVAPAVARIRGLVEVARSGLRVVLGFEAGSPLEVLPVQTGLQAAASFARSFETACQRRPELAGLQLQGQALGKQKAITRAGGRPQINLNAAYGREARIPANLSEPLFASWAVVLGMRWELFEGGRRRAQLARFESQQRQLEWQYRDLLNRVALEVEQALAEYRTAQERWRSAEFSAQAAREARRVARENYAEGVALHTALLDAQERETEAEVLLVDAYYDALINAARLSRALGLVPTADWDQVATLEATATENAGDDSNN
jgi:outer membrane protein TolC